MLFRSKSRRIIKEVKTVERPVEQSVEQSVKPPETVEEFCHRFGGSDLGEDAKLTV